MSDLQATLSAEEQATLRTAAYGAVQLLSVAYPGVLSTARENIAGAKALSGATGPVGHILADAGRVELKGSAADVADIVLPALSQTTATLAAKAPDQVAEFRRIVTTAVEQAAGSTGGPNKAQRDMLEQIDAALQVNQ